MEVDQSVGSALIVEVRDDSDDPEEEGRVVLHDVAFDFDMATLRPSARVILDVAAEEGRQQNRRVEFVVHDEHESN